MPSRDAIHPLIVKALVKEGWEITDDPYVISYGERFLFVDLGAIFSMIGTRSSRFVGAAKGEQRIAVEIKAFSGRSAIADLEQAIGQYSLYQLLLNQVDKDRMLYLAVTNTAFEEIFSEPIGELVIRELPLKLIVVDIDKVKVMQWIS